MPVLVCWLMKPTDYEVAFMTVFSASDLIFLLCLELLQKEKPLYGS